jgi:general stress protein YciG
MAVNCFEDNKGKMIIEGVVRRGGLKTSKKHRELFFREIGRKGGERRGKRNMGYWN